MMARLFFATFWSIFFVGAVRKWMFPNFGLLYLAQDLPIALAYLYAFRAGFVRRTPLLWGFLLLSAVVMLQAFTQMLVLGLPPLVTLVGLHHYIFYTKATGLIFSIKRSPQGGNNCITSFYCI